MLHLWNFFAEFQLDQNSPFFFRFKQELHVRRGPVQPLYFPTKVAATGICSPLLFFSISWVQKKMNWLSSAVARNGRWGEKWQRVFFFFHWKGKIGRRRTATGSTRSFSLLQQWPRHKKTEKAEGGAGAQRKWWNLSFSWKSDESSVSRK